MKTHADGVNIILRLVAGELWHIVAHFGNDGKRWIDGLGFFHGHAL